jgi:hypothetical protein
MENGAAGWRMKVAVFVPHTDHVSEYPSIMDEK